MVYNLYVLNYAIAFIYVPSGIFCWEAQDERQYHAEPEAGNDPQRPRQAVSVRLRDQLQPLLIPLWKEMGSAHTPPTDLRYPRKSRFVSL